MWFNLTTFTPGLTVSPVPELRSDWDAASSSFSSFAQVQNKNNNLKTKACKGPSQCYGLLFEFRGRKVNVSINWELIKQKWRRLPLYTAAFVFCCGQCPLVQRMIHKQEHSQAGVRGLWWVNFTNEYWAVKLRFYLWETAADVIQKRQHLC